MPTTTRSGSSGKSAHTTPSSSPQNGSKRAGTKRKADGTPTKSKGERVEVKKQKTIEDTLQKDETSDAKDVQMKSEEQPAEEGVEDKTEQQTDAKGEEDKGVKEDEPEKKGKEKEPPKDEDKAENGDKSESKTEPKSESKPESKPESKDSSTDKSKETGGSAVHKDESRAKSEPSNILEKGLIYFFFRGRVSIEDPGSVTDIQRSYILLRPLPSGASLGDGAVHSGGKARILALPKKTLPKSPRDRFLTWVEAANASFDEIKTQHLARDEYSTQSSGDRTVPAAQPAAEGIYAVTATGRDSHLVYLLTTPDPLGDVQKELGLAERGAFVTSVRNPDTDAPQGTAPTQRADYPKDIMEDFRGLRWGRLEPRHLDYKDTQFLLIGEGEDGKLEKSVDASEGDGTRNDKQEPKEELELLEKEDEDRIKNLSGDDSDAIFKDLGLSKEEYSKIKTEW